MKSLRFFIRLFLTFFSRLKKIIILGFILGIFSFFFLPRLAALLPARKETKMIGRVGHYTLENLPADIQGLASQGLTQLEKDGSPRPGLAKEWRVEEEGKVYTFSLKENLYWHDGSRVQAQDVNYNFEDVQISVLDEKTLRFVLKEPFSPLPVIVSRPVFKKGFVGVGSYRLKKITRRGQFIELVQLESVTRNGPNLSYRFYPTEEAAKTGLKLGEVKVLENITEATGFEGWENIKIIPKVRFDQYVAIFFKTDLPYFEEKNFRQALAYALPKEEEKPRAFGPLSPHSWAYTQEIKHYDYNPEKAKKLFSKGREEKKKISLRLATIPSLLGEAEKIKKAWEELGLQTEIEALKSLEGIEALLAIQEIPSDPDQYSFWHSTQKTGNITNFKNPRIDKLLEDGRKTQDREKRKKIYYDFQRFLGEEVPAVFLFHPTVWEIAKE